MTPEERAELRDLHADYIGGCDDCLEAWPCAVTRLLDALDEAERLNVVLTARLDEFATKLGRRVEN